METDINVFSPMLWDPPDSRRVCTDGSAIKRWRECDRDYHHFLVSHYREPFPTLSCPAGFPGGTG